MKYLKYFKQYSDYQSYMNGEGEVYLPNLSYVVGNNFVYFNPTKGKLEICYKFDETNVPSYPHSMLINTNLFKSFKVNGVEYIQQQSENGPETIVVNDIMTYNGDPSVFENYKENALNCGEYSSIKITIPNFNPETEEICVGLYRNDGENVMFDGLMGLQMGMFTQINDTEYEATPDLIFLINDVFSFEGDKIKFFIFGVESGYTPNTFITKPTSIIYESKNLSLYVVNEPCEITANVEWLDNNSDENFYESAFESNTYLKTANEELFKNIEASGSLNSMFGDCYSLTSLDLSNFGVSNVIDMSAMFAFCTGLDSLDLSNWDTSKVTNVRYMFNYCTGLTSLDLSGWDISEVTDMEGMFYKCHSLTSLDGISNWDTSKVPDMSHIFEDCYSLTSLDLSKWDTSDVTTMSYMFANCYALTSLDLSNWDTSNVTKMYSMFDGCASLTEVKMGGDVSKVTGVSDMFSNVAPVGTFYYNPSYDYSKIIAQLPSGWTAVVMANNMKCTELTIEAEDASGRATATTITYTATLTGTSITDGSVITWSETGTDISSEFSQNTSETEERQVEISFSYKGMTATATITQGTYNDNFGMGIYSTSSNVTPVKLIYSGLTNISDMYIDGTQVTPISAYTFSTTGNHNVDMTLKNNVTGMNSMFKQCRELTSLDLSNWDTSNVTDMKSMFYDCGSLTSLDLSNWDTGNVTNMNQMFYYCSKLASIGDLSTWDTHNVTDMFQTFRNCESLTSLDLSNWDTSNVTNMSWMFNYCSKLTSVGDLSDWDVSKVRGMSYMFNGCGSLTSLDSITNWDTSNVIGMDNMFNGCGSLTSLDSITNWDTSNVTGMTSMFRECSGITSLDLSNWDTSNVTYTDYMFSGCTSLTSLDLTNWDTSKVTRMYGMFGGCTGLTSLDLTNWGNSKITDLNYLFEGCQSLTEVKMGGDMSKVKYTRSMFDNVASAGTFYYNSQYNYSKIILQLPSEWTAVPCTMVDGVLVPNN